MLNKTKCKETLFVKISGDNFFNDFIQEYKKQMEIYAQKGLIKAVDPSVQMEFTKKLVKNVFHDDFLIHLKPRDVVSIMFLPTVMQTFPQLTKDLKRRIEYNAESPVMKPALISMIKILQNASQASDFTIEHIVAKMDQACSGWLRDLTPKEIASIDQQHQDYWYENLNNFEKCIEDKEKYPGLNLDNDNKEIKAYLFAQTSGLYKQYGDNLSNWERPFQYVARIYSWKKTNIDHKSYNKYSRYPENKAVLDKKSLNLEQDLKLAHANSFIKELKEYISKGFFTTKKQRDQFKQEYDEYLNIVLKQTFNTIKEKYPEGCYFYHSEPGEYISYHSKEHMSENAVRQKLQTDMNFAIYMSAQLSECLNSAQQQALTNKLLDTSFCSFILDSGLYSKLKESAHFAYIDSQLSDECTKLASEIGLFLAQTAHDHNLDFDTISNEKLATIITIQQIAKTAGLDYKDARDMISNIIELPDDSKGLSYIRKIAIQVHNDLIYQVAHPDSDSISVGTQLMEANAMSYILKHCKEYNIDSLKNMSKIPEFYADKTRDSCKPSAHEYATILTIMADTLGPDYMLAGKDLSDVIQAEANKITTQVVKSYNPGIIARFQQAQINRTLQQSQEKFTQSITTNTNAQEKIEALPEQTKEQVQERIDTITELAGTAGATPENPPLPLQIDLQNASIATNITALAQQLKEYNEKHPEKEHIVADELETIAMLYQNAANLIRSTQNVGHDEIAQEIKKLIDVESLENKQGDVSQDSITRNLKLILANEQIDEAEKFLKCMPDTYMIGCRNIRNNIKMRWKLITNMI